MNEFDDFINNYNEINDKLNNVTNNSHLMDITENSIKLAELFDCFELVYEYGIRTKQSMSIFTILAEDTSKSSNDSLLTEIDEISSGGYIIGDLVVNDYDMCTECNVRYKFNNINKLYTCPGCGVGFTTNEFDFTQFYVEHNGISNLNDSIQNVHSPSEHNRIKHFIGYIDKMMGTEIITIPSKVFITIDKELKKDNIQINTIYFNFNLLKKYLKRNKLNKWIAHIAKIYRRYTNRNLINPLTVDERSKIITMYANIQSDVIYYLLGIKRKNFPTCWYFIRKITEHFEISLDVDIFHKIKMDQNTRNLDNIWKYVCQQINIKFIPTM